MLYHLIFYQIFDGETKTVNIGDQFHKMVKIEGSKLRLSNIFNKCTRSKKKKRKTSSFAMYTFR